MVPRSQVLLWIVLATMFVAGTAMSAYVPQQLPTDWKIARKVVEEFGLALMIASLLALTVDRVLKIEIARDVFYAAFRYVLPEELKAEVARIIDYRFICTHHHTIIEITEVGEGLVRVHMSAERTLKNISSQPQSLEGRFAIDDWGFDEHRSHIEQCTMEVGQERLSGNPNPEYDQEDAIGYITESRMIKSGETAKMVIKGYEFHRTNSVMLMGFRTPTVKPTLEIHLPEGFKHKHSFGVPGERIVRSEIAKRYTLDGAQFPSQNVWLRWWKPDASASSAERSS